MVAFFGMLLFLQYGQVLNIVLEMIEPTMTKKIKAKKKINPNIIISDSLEEC